MNELLGRLLHSAGEEDLVSVAVRFSLAIVLAGLLGLERESRGRAAGLRTHILVCLGSTLLMVISDFLAQEFNATSTTFMLDRGRIAAGIVTGVGFLGAGTIVNIGREPRGLTTAAMIWFAACLGVAIGSGYYFTAALSTVAVLFVFRGLGIFERLVSTREHLLLMIELPGEAQPNDVEQAIHKSGCLHTQFKRVHANLTENMTTLEYQLDLRERDGCQRILDGLRKRFPEARNIDLRR